MSLAISRMCPIHFSNLPHFRMWLSSEEGLESPNPLFLYRGNDILGGGKGVAFLSPSTSKGWGTLTLSPGFQHARLRG
jgi:hypothetical protein